MRWQAVLAVSMVVVAGSAATASSTTAVSAPSGAGEETAVATAVSAAGLTGAGGVGVIPPEPAIPQTPRGAATEAGTPSDLLSQVPPPAPAGAGVLGEGPLAIPELVFYAYRAAEMQLAINSPECGLPWHLLASIGRLESDHGDGGRTDVLGTLSTPKVSADGALGPMQLPPAVWERFPVDGNADGAANPQNVFDATLAAGTWMCDGGASLREPEAQARAVALLDPSPEYLANVRKWSAAYEKGAEVTQGAVVPAQARPVPGVPAPADVAAPVSAAPAPAAPLPAAPAEPAPQVQETPAPEPSPALPELPDLPDIPCLVPALCE